MISRVESPPIASALYSVAATTVLCLSACITYPDSSERLNDDLVFTGYSKEANFKQYQTFAIDPDISKAKVNADNSVETSTVDKTFGDEVVGRIASKLEARGYRQVGIHANPDLGVTVTAVSSTTIGVVSGAYWGGYYATYWGFPGWSYYYPYDTYYTYTPGAIVVDIVDLSKGGVSASEIKDAVMGDAGAPAGGLPVVWAMIGYKAYVDDNTSTNTVSADQAIEQAFSQSPYLSRM